MQLNAANKVTCTCMQQVNAVTIQCCPNVRSMKWYVRICFNMRLFPYVDYMRWVIYALVRIGTSNASEYIVNASLCSGQKQHRIRAETTLTPSLLSPMQLSSPAAAFDSS